MSQENVELVKAGFAAYNRGDMDALVEFYDPEVVFETLLLGTHHGTEAIRVIYEENRRPCPSYDVVPVELDRCRGQGGGRGSNRWCRYRQRDCRR